MIPKTEPSRYFEAVGRRKTAVARVRLFMSGAASKDTEFKVNEKSYKQYFPLVKQHKALFSPMELLSVADKLRGTIKVSGGGLSAQSEAVRHGIARALVLIDKNFKKKLRRAGYLTRDSRMVERKKYGLKKARRAPQWKKR